MRKFANADWELEVSKKNSDSLINTEEAQLAVLMDIRRELQKLNKLLNCQNFLSIPKYLRLLAERKKRRNRK